MQGIRPMHIEVDGSAVAHNVLAIQNLCRRPVHLIAPLKANAYGHGALGVARYLEQIGVYAIATGDAAAAIALREEGVRSRILMFPCHLASGIGTLIRHRLIPTVCSFEDARAVAEAVITTGTKDEPYPIFVKVDCGLGRFGVLLEHAYEVILRITRLPNIRIEGVYTHLPFFDDAGCAWAQRQTQAFESLIYRLQSEGIHIPIAQAAASAAIAAGFPQKLNAIASGHLLYGLSPSDTQPLPEGLRPAISALRSHLLHVANYPDTSTPDLAGRFYGRGSTLDAAAVRRAGVFLLGIANGYCNPVHREDAFVLIRGCRAPVLGVSAEYTVVDLTRIPDACGGDEVVIIGRDGAEHVSVSDVAGYLGMSPLMCLLGLRDIPYRYLSLDATSDMERAA